MTTNKYDAFIAYLFTQIERDKGFAAKLRRADNPSTEYQSWEILARFNVNLDRPSERLPYALIAAAVAKSKQPENGQLLIGQAIAKSFDDGAKSDQAAMRLRRLLACQDTEEVCRILRPLLSFIQSRVKAPLDFTSLLKDLLFFNLDPQKAKAKWAQQFFSSVDKQEKASGEGV